MSQQKICPQKMACDNPQVSKFVLIPCAFDLTRRALSNGTQIMDQAKKLKMFRETKK